MEDNINIEFNNMFGLSPKDFFSDEDVLAMQKATYKHNMGGVSSSYGESIGLAPLDDVVSRDTALYYLAENAIENKYVCIDIQQKKKIRSYNEK